MVVTELLLADLKGFSAEWLDLPEFLEAQHGGNQAHQGPQGVRMISAQSFPSLEQDFSIQGLGLPISSLL